MRSTVSLINVVALLLSVACAAGELKSQARETAEKRGNAIVTVRVVALIKQNAGGQTRDFETKFEAPAVVIDPSGLTVTAASLVDPSAAMARMRIEIEIKEALLILSDGTEIPADVVLKDTDLDLAFIRPKDESKKLDAIELKPRATPVQALEDVFVVGRLNKLGNRSISYTFGLVKAVVKAPRPFFVCDNEIASQTGCLVFGADGQPIGLAVAKFSKEPGVSNRESSLAIVCAVEDVIEIANQAKTAKKDNAEKKPDAEKKEEKK